MPDQAAATGAPDSPGAGAAQNGDHNSARPEWLVTADRVRLWEDAFRKLHISVDGKDYEDVRPRRAFPISTRSPFVSFMSEKSEETVLLADPAGLPAESRAVLDRFLNRVYYCALVTKVYSITETMGVSLWHVLTDHGHATFEVVDRERHIRLLPGGRFQITDADGNRFDIPCVYDLDEASQNLIETET